MRGKTFRPDIEGLRAVAVIAVVFYHLKFSWMPGGFIGVDVFFTISGFLMAEIIADDLRNGGFSLWGFYKRRMLRIWPALLLVMLVTFLVGLYLLLPLQLVELGKTTAFSLLLASNVFFWLQTGYFAPAAENNLLLHLWSLAVEQQFYLFVPFLMLIAFPGRGRDWRWIVAATTVASLIVCIVMTPRMPVASFYLLPTRIWEFLLGACVALFNVERRSHRLFEEIASAVGLTMIIAAATCLNGSVSYPGYWALLPCGGTALVIAANAYRPTVCGQALASRPCGVIGRLSYSIYLWHWPILTFCRLSGVSIDVMPVQVLILAATLVCSFLSWQFVEVPFRKPAFASAKLRLAAVASTAFSLVAISAAALATNGLPFRLDPQTRELLAYQSYPLKPTLYREGECFLVPGEAASDFREDKCSDRFAGRSNVLLWGDSHAAHFAPGMREDSAKFGINIVQATYGGCAPVPFRPSNSGPCVDFGNKILAMASSGHFKAVAISANWTGYPAILPELSKMIQSLARNGPPIIVIGPSVEFTSALPVLLAGTRSGLRPPPRSPAGWLSDAAVKLDGQMNGLFSGTLNVIYVSPISEVCPKHVCPVLLDNGVPLTWDATHLTAEGSRLVSGLILRRISPIFGAQIPRTKSTNL